MSRVWSGGLPIRAYARPQDTGSQGGSQSGRGGSEPTPPVAFDWRGGHEEIVEILDSWRDTGAWWEREEEKVFIRVRTRRGGTFELFRGAAEPEAGAGARVGARAGAVWKLYKVYD